MSFHKQSFANRFAAMGDEAEGIFDLVHPKNHALGLNRPPFSMRWMPAVARYVPDRMNDKAFWEVQGLGRDRTLKIKFEKLDALDLWDGLWCVKFFIWDKTTETVYEGDYADWLAACKAFGNHRVYPEGKDYWALNVDNFPVEGSPLQDLVNPDLLSIAA